MKFKDLQKEENPLFPKFDQKYNGEEKLQFLREFHKLMEESIEEGSLEFPPQHAIFQALLDFRKNWNLVDFDPIHPNEAQSKIDPKTSKMDFAILGLSSLLNQAGEKIKTNQLSFLEIKKSYPNDPIIWEARFYLRNSDGDLTKEISLKTKYGLMEQILSNFREEKGLVPRAYSKTHKAIDGVKTLVTYSFTVMDCQKNKGQLILHRQNL